VNEFFKAIDYIKSQAPKAFQQFFPAGYYHTDTSLIDDREVKEPEPSGYNGENITKIDFEHQELIKGFCNKEKGLLANKLLIKLERLNKREFHRWIGDLEGLVEELEEKSGHKQNHPPMAKGE
jgi:hypothetical protein